MKKKFYVNGEWVEGATYQKLISPHTQTVLAEIPQATKEQVAEAIAIAEQTNDQMAALTALERAEILEHIAALLTASRQQAAEIISNEAGKPLKYSLGEIDRTIETYKFAAEEAKRLTGEMIPMDAAKSGAGRFGYTVQEPIGVIGAITPFNFPQNLVAHKVGPAIASGNTIVLKPASQTPLSALFLAELIDQTNLPKGAFNVVTGSGRVAGNALVESDIVKMVTFTGSPSVGIGIRNQAGLKKVALELGSNAGLIVDQQTDLEKIVPRCIIGAFANQGQVCISLQRTYVHEALADEFIVKFKEQTAQLRIGNPLEESTDLSAMIHPDEQERAVAWVEEAVANGATLVSGGKIEDGVFLPTILTDVRADVKVSCQEVFAPIVIINRITSIEEGILAINDSEFGLQAGIYTNDIQTAFNAAKKLQVGGVIINDIPTYRVDQMPYGGVKKSGTGKEGLKYAIHEMTESKIIVWNNQ